MGNFLIPTRHFRFAFKLTFAIILAMFIGFHFELDTPRWSVVTAAIVSVGPAFAVGGEPSTGAIRYRGMLRVCGTFVGSVVALIIITMMIQAPFLMLLTCCLWIGFCTWVSSLVRKQDSYAWGLAGYTALIIVITIQNEPLLAPQTAIERCSEITIGIICAIISDILFSPRSIKNDIDHEINNQFIDQYNLIQLCILNKNKGSIDSAMEKILNEMVTLEEMNKNLHLESSLRDNYNARIKEINSVSLTLINISHEIFKIQKDSPGFITDSCRDVFKKNVNTAFDINGRIRQLKTLIKKENSNRVKKNLINDWLLNISHFQEIKSGFLPDTKLIARKNMHFNSEIVIRAKSPQRYHALLNFWRTTLSCFIGTIFWFWTGWSAGGGAVMMIAIITSLAIHTPNPRIGAMDFLYGTISGIPLGALYFLIIIPSSQQSMLLLCVSLAILAFFSGVEIQKRRLGAIGMLLSTLNSIVLSNPMSFNFSLFLNNAFGQLIGCVIALITILLISGK